MGVKKRTPSVQPPKSYEILVSTPEAHAKVKGFYDDKHPERPPMMLNKYGQAVIHDSGIAQEIQQRFGAKKYGGDGSVTVVPVHATVGREKRKQFSFPRIPWKKE